MAAYEVRALGDADRTWVQAFVIAHWGSEIVVGHGVVFHPHTLPGFAAWDGAECVGLLTYQIAGAACEIVTIDSVREGAGVGGALMAAAAQTARAAGCARLWLVTTNDNMRALRFYQRRGFRIVAVHPGAVDRARQLKPGIPLLGFHGIPLRDELELAMEL